MNSSKFFHVLGDIFVSFILLLSLELIHSLVAQMSEDEATLPIYTSTKFGPWYVT